MKWFMFLLLCCSAQGALLFTEQETLMLEESRLSASSSEPQVLLLQGILFMSPTDWSIWLNGEKISYPGGHADYKIHSISASHVELTWQGKRVRLAPNQSARKENNL